jgi:DNA-binding transcriptional regulator GbsR (MarR family)
MKTLKDIEDRKKDIIERYGLFMEKSEKFAPISARIFSTLLLAERKGATFDDLVNFLGASKSTISTNLQRLSNMKVVDYYTKPGDRKKYFHLSPIGFISFLEEDISKFRAEKTLVKEVIEFKKTANKIIDDPNLRFESPENNPFFDYLTSSILSLEKLKKQIQLRCALADK